MDGSVFPSGCLVWEQTMVGVVAVMQPPSKGLTSPLLYSASLTLQQSIVDPHLHWRLLDTHRQVWLSLLWAHCSFLLGPGAHKVLFGPSRPKSVSPVLWKFYNQIPLASKVKFPGDSSSLYRISRVGNLLWVLELSKQCGNFFGIIVLPFMGYLLDNSMVDLMATSCNKAYGTC